MSASKLSHKQAYNQTILLKRLFELNEPLLVFNARRFFALWLCFTVSFVCSIFTGWAIFTWEVHEAAGSQAGALAIKTGLLVMGNLLFGVCLWLAPRYVTKIELLPGRLLLIHTWWGKKQKISLSELLHTPKLYTGKTQLHGVPNVSAPWIKLSFRNKKTLLVDMQADFPEGYMVFDKMISTEV